jgi:large subunit ribosomal protein L4e
MKINVKDLDGNTDGTVDAPSVFDTTIRPDLIKKAHVAEMANDRQDYGAKPEAGNRHSTYLSKKRRDYRSSYGIGQSRTPRKALSSSGRQFYWVGAEAPHTVGGRRAHPPKAEKNRGKKVNQQEKQKAKKSALSAVFTDHTRAKHLVPDEYPFILTDDFHDLEKTKEAHSALVELGFEDELQRTKQKNQRSGKGTKRGRKHQTKVGPLVVLPEDAKAHRALRNIPGITTKTPSELTFQDLTPGSHPGRLTLFTETTIQDLPQ